MESNTITLNNSNVVDKKMRKPSLPAKFNKFIQFGYFFLNQYNAMEGVTPIDETSFLDKLHLFDTVDNQQAFVQSFFDDAKNINKTIRKVIQTKKKADAKAEKPPKVKTPRVKKSTTNTDTDTNNDSSPIKTSRRKKKIAVVPDVQDELISELTSLANNTIQNNTDTLTDTLTDTDTVTVTEVEKPKTEKKPKVEKPKVEKPKAEKKPKVQKNTEIINNYLDNDNDNDYDIDEPEIVTSPIILNGIQYLVDDNYNIYHFDNHSLIGSLNHTDNSISLY